jgi:succinate dehydrogenase / fumarate reductase membrane anchor subunit
LSLISPLNRVLGLGTGRGATEHWWAQRLTAVALVPLGLWFAFSMLRFESFDYASVASWLQQPVSAILLIIMTLALIHHSFLGVQVVVEDYVHAKALKILLLLASTFAHFAGAIAGVFSILKVAFG